VQGVILNKPMLKTLAMAIGGGLTTFITSLLAYTQKAAHTEQESAMLSEIAGGCDLSDSDVGIITDIFDGRDCPFVAVSATGA
jgi:hypothetical protein